MKTIFEVPTKGDSMTMPGGIALRWRDKGNGSGEFVVHNFNTDRETLTKREYFQGSYMWHDENDYATAFADAMTELTRRVTRATGYDRGGSIDLTGMIVRGVPA